MGNHQAVKSPETSTSASRGSLRVGTSGWSYDHWRGVFYPEHLPAGERLAHYASVFNTLEINSTFYGLPKEDAAQHWHDAVPQDFVFAIKGSRYVTHIKRLRDVGEDVERLTVRLRPLANKAGPLLWQLPPNLKYDLGLLEEFLSVLPDSFRHAIEFRDDSWLTDTTLQLLGASDVAVVNVSGDQLREDLTPSASFVYARFHGTRRYHGSYAAPQLEPWAEYLGERLRRGNDCYAYFNNDAEGHAPGDAVRLREMLGAALLVTQ